MTESAHKPVIFLAFANYHNGTVGQPLNLPDEERRVRQKLEAAEGLCEFVARSNCTADDIFKVLQDARYRDRIAIFHFSGHANSLQLLLETRDGQAAAADASGLASFLAAQHGLRLVFLNGCSTRQQAQGLLDANKNLAAVIATSRAIDDRVAIEFSERFYAALAQGTKLRTAFDEARAAITTTRGSDHRKLYFGDAHKDAPDDSRDSSDAPWNLYEREGSAEIVDQWSLPGVANDRLFGLPPLDETNLPESPYKHLNWFTNDDAEIFFGRGRQIREMYDALTSGSQPVILFYGQSGVGKSSLLDAGLLPRLKKSCEVRYARRGDKGLLTTLKQTLGLAADDATPIETAWRAREKEKGKPLSVILDQVEECYTRPIPDLPDELNQLLTAAEGTFGDPAQRPRGKLVLGFREEWLARLEDEVKTFQLPRTKIFLKPLDRDGIIEVVQGPTRSQRLRERYALTIDDGLAAELADDLLADRGSAIATTLQILLSKLWDKATEIRSEPPKFTRDLYLDLKGKGILLGDFLDQQLQAFGARMAEPAKSGLLLDVLALHTTPLGTSNQCSRDSLLEQYAHVRNLLPNLLQQCQDLYLLTEATRTQKETNRTTRLAHDTLAPLVRERFDVSDKPGQRARRILDNRSVDWEHDRTGTPLDEADLTVVETGVAGTRELNATEQRLVEASLRLRAKLRRTRQALRLVGSLAVIVIAALGAFGWWARGLANQRAKELDSENQGLVGKTNLAEEKSKLAVTNEGIAKRRAYDFSLKLNEAAWNRGEVTLASNLFNGLRDQDPQALFRSWEWHYQRRLLEDDNRSLLGHKNRVYAVGFSPNGRLIASASLDGVVKIWSASSGRELRSWRDAKNEIMEVCFSPDSRQLLTTGSDHTAKLWDVESGERIRSIKFGGSVLGVAYSPDGNAIAIASADDTASDQVNLYEAATGRLVRSFKGDARVAWTVSFSPDGGLLASGGNEGVIRVWETATGKEVANLAGHRGMVKAVKFSPDGRWFGALYKGGGLAPEHLTGNLIVWDWESQREFRRFSVDEESFDFSPDGELIAGASAYEVLTVWNVLSGEVVRRFRGHGAWVFGVSFDPVGHRIVSSGGDGQLRLWSLSDYRTPYISDGRFWTIAFNPDSTGVAVTGPNDDLKVIDMESGNVVSKLEGVGKYTLSPDWSLIGRDFTIVDPKTIPPGAPSSATTRPGKETVYYEKKHYTITERLTGKELVSFPAEFVNVAAFSPDNTQLALGGSFRGSLELWDIAKKEVKTLNRVERKDVVLDSIDCLSFSSDGRLLAAGGPDGLVRVWDLESGKVTAMSSHENRVSSVAFDRFARRLASSGGGEIYLSDVSTGERLLKLTGHSSGVSGVAFIGTGDRLVSSGDEVKVWDTTNGQEVRSFEGKNRFNCVCASPDGWQIAAGTEGGNVWVWDARPLTDELRSERDARELVHWLQSRPLLIADVIEAIKLGETLDPVVKQKALAFAHMTTDEPDNVNNTSWLLVRNTRCPIQKSKSAAKSMERIARDRPTGTYLNTYGVALYRAGDYVNAIRVLSESDRQNKGVPSDIAFLAMAHFRLGDHTKATEELARLRRAMKLIRWSTDTESLNFAREAETLLAPDLPAPSGEGGRVEPTGER